MTKSPKCLIVTNNFFPIRGGSAIVYENLCKFAEGSILVLAPQTDYETGEPLHGWQDHDRAANYTIYRLPSLRSSTIPSRSLLHSIWSYIRYELPLKLRVLSKVAKIVIRHNVKIICIGELITGGWLAAPCKYLLGRRIIAYIHGEEITTRMPGWRLPKRRKHYLKVSDSVVAVSAFTRDALLNQMGIERSKVHLIYNSVDPEKFFPQPKDRDLESHYGLREHRVLLSVGRLVERKGIDRVLQALPPVLQRHPDIHYLVVGDGPYRSDLERIARDAGVSEHVTFAGALEDKEIAKHYALCDIFLLPNRETADGDTEGFGLVFLEANACGKPVIAGRAGGVVDAVQDGYNGLTVDGNDTSAITAAILSLLEDSELYTRLQKGGLEKANSSDWRRRTEQFQMLCQRLLA